MKKIYRYHTVRLFLCAAFFILFLASLNAQPVITGISPSAGKAYTSVTISGSNFSSTISDNIVWFGGVKATVTAASANSLTAKVPPGAGSIVRVYTSGLVAQSPVQFILSFPDGASLSASSFPGYTTPQSPVIQNGSYNGLSNHSYGNLKFADLDGDGKPDMINGRVGVYIQFNTSTPGSISGGTINYGNNTITGASFEARYSGGVIQAVLSELTSYQTNASQEGDIDVGDVDGDGKLDIVSCVYRPANGDRVSVFRNVTSAPGSLTASNFASPVTYSTGGRWARRVRLADFDNDGKLDILISTYGGGGAVLRNTSTPGSVSFAAIANLSAGISEDFIETADLDGDGKIDIVTRPWGNSQVKALRNTSSGSGSISFAAMQAFNVEAGGTGIELGDIDGDGKTDVLASGNSGKLYVLRNTSSSGSVSFAAFYTINTTSSINVGEATLGDLDGDGKTDIAFNDGNYGIFVVKNNSTSGNLSFGTYVAVNPSGGLAQYVTDVVIQDIDANGGNDIVSISQYTNGINFFGNAALITLPVNWLGFTGRSQANGVMLEWATASEENNDYFEIERSEDGQNFTAQGRIPHAANSITTHNYDWLDATAPHTILWYRIKQADIDGKNSYSKIIRVDNSRSVAVSISPNPVTNHLQLSLSAGNNNHYDLSIFDYQGKLVLQRKLNAGNATIDCANWSAGLYRLVIYKGDNQILSESFFKQ